MKGFSLGGSLLVIFGAVALVYWGISLTTDQRVVNPGRLPALRREAASTSKAAAVPGETAAAIEKAEKKVEKTDPAAKTSPAADVDRAVPLAPIFGGACIVGGVVLLTMGARRNRKLLA